MAVLLATAVFQLTAAETKRETMDRRVRAAIAGFQGTVRLYARNLDTGETYGIGENEKVRTSCHYGGGLPRSRLRQCELG